MVVYLGIELLRHNHVTHSLLEDNPFPDKPPKLIKMDLYRYRLVSPWSKNSAWYERIFVRNYLPPISLDHPAVQRLIKNRESMR